MARQFEYTRRKWFLPRILHVEMFDLLRRLSAEMVGRSLALELVRGGARTRAELLVGERQRRQA